MTDKMTDKPESAALRKLKPKLAQIEVILKKESNPSNTLRDIEMLMTEIDSPTDERFDIFSNKLLKVVQRILERGDFEEGAIQRISVFLKKVVHYVVQLIPHDLDITWEILNTVFSWEKKWLFYRAYGRDNQLYNIDEVQQKGEIFTNDDWNVSKIMLANISYFIHCNGHLMICGRISDVQKKITFTHMHQDLKIIEKIHDMLRHDITEKVLSHTVEIVFKYLSGMTVDEVKYVEKKAVMEVIEICKKILERVYARSTAPIESLERTERFRLSLALQWLRLPYLNKRIEGLADISYFCKHFILKSSGYMTHVQKTEPEKLWIDSKFMREWLQENKIVEYLFSKASHQEIIRRSGDILQFLALEGQIDESHIDLIWGASQDQHESIIHQVWNILGNLTQFLGTPVIDYLFDKIKNIPMSLWDNQLILFVQRVTDNGIARVLLDKQNKRWYGIDLFWNGILDNTGLSLEVAYQCLQSLGYFIQLDKYDREALINKCIENLHKNTSVPQTMSVLTKIIGTFKVPGDQQGDKIIVWLEQEHHLSELFFNNLATYSEFVMNNKDKVPAGMNVDVFTFCGYYSHGQYLAQLLEFLSYVYKNSKLGMSEQQLDILWQATITNAISEGTKDTVLRWLQGTVETFLPKQTAQYIFNTKISQLDFRTLSMAGFTFFHHYFIHVNSLQGKIQRKQDEIIVHDLDLLGIDNLWRTVLETENPEVATSAINLLNRLQKSPGPSLQTHTAEHREHYLSRCMSSLRQAANTYNSCGEHNPPHKASLELGITRSLKLILNFIEFFEVGIVQEKHGTGARGTEIQLKVKDLTTAGFTVDTHGNETLGEFRTKVATEYDGGKHQPEQLRLIVGGKELKEDTTLMKDTNLQNGQTVYVTQRKVITGPNLPTNTVTVPTVPTTRPPLTEEERNILPSTLLAQDKYFEQFFLLLNYMPGDICSQIWDILEKLPTNTKLKTDFQNLQPLTKWNTLLDPQSIFKLYYSLQIVETFTQNNKDSLTEKEQKNAWGRLFIQTGGLKHLFFILLYTDFLLPSQGNKRIVCLALLLKIINFFTLDMEVEPPRLRGESFVALGVNEQDLLQKLFEITFKVSIPANQQLNVLSGLVPKKTENDEVVIAAMPLLATVSLNPALLPKLFELAFGEWLETVLFSNPLQPSREAAALGIYQICSPSRTAVPEDLSPPKRFLHKLLEFLKFDEKNPTNNPTCSEYFLLLNRLVRDACRGFEKLPPPFDKLLQMVISMLLAHPIIEANAQSVEDKILIGLLNLVRTLLIDDCSAKTEIGPHLVPVIFHRCLFDIPTLEHEGNPPTCKTAASRRAAFDLLSELIRLCEPNMETLCVKLIAYHQKQTFKKQWQYFPQAYEKASCGYVGLKNLGATCYMNSIMQQFYMVPQFRYKVFSIEDKSEDKSESVLHQMQAIFANLQESEKKYYDTRDFCKSYKVDGEPMKTHEQMDVDEFFAQLFDKLDSILKGTLHEKMLQDFFGGTLVNQIISKECEHCSERAETSFNLQLEVKNKHKLTDSLDLFVQGDMLDGDNKYFCDHCKTKVAALKRCCIGNLPNNLVVHLKRFEFDLELMRRNKINQYCEFPHTLNLEPYTSEGLLRRENAERAATAAAANSDVPTTPSTPDPPTRPASYYEYELSGILVHSGTTESGHYYSFVRDGETKQWFQFNDIHVSPFDPAQIPEQCYGGFDVQNVWDPVRRRFIQRNVPRSYSAYLLFYERCNPERPAVDQPIPSSDQSQVVPKELYNQVWEKNMKFLMDKHLFDKDYIGFVQGLVGMFDPEKLIPVQPVTDISEISNSEEYPRNDPLLKVIQLGTRFLIQTLSHAHEKKILPEFTNRLKKLYSVHIPSCQWFIHRMTENSGWITEMLLLCTVAESREAFAKLVGHVGRTIDTYENSLYFEEDPLPPEPSLEDKKKKIKKSTDKEEEQPDEGMKLLKITGIPKSLNLRFLDSVIKMYPTTKSHWRNYHHFWMLFQEFSTIGTPLRKVMLSRGYLQLFCHIYLGDYSPYYSLGKIIKENKTKERLQAERQALQNMKYLLGAVATLVCSCRIDRDTADVGRSPEQLDDEILDMSKEDSALVLGDKFLFQAMGDDANNEAMAAMLRHMSWGNFFYSKRAIDGACDGINKYDGERFIPFFSALKAVLSLEDALQASRVDYALKRYLKVVADNIKYKNATKIAIGFLVEFAPENQFVSEFLRSHMDLWVQWVTYTVGEKHELEEMVRFHVETLIMEMVPEVKGYVVSVKPDLAPTSITVSTATVMADPMSTSAMVIVPAADTVSSDTIVTEPEYSEEVVSRIGKILRHLLSLFDDLAKNPYEVPTGETIVTVNTAATSTTVATVAAAVEEKETTPFRLVSLFRLLQWCILSQKEQEIILEDNFRTNFVTLYQNIDMKHVDCDLNKAELYRFWEKITRNNVRISSAFAEDRNSRNRLFDTWIKLTPIKQQIVYNNESLPAFYEVVLQCATHSEGFKHELVRNPNFEWAIKHMLLESKDYPKPAAVLRRLVDVGMNSDTETRRCWVRRIIQIGLPVRQNNWNTVFEILIRVLHDTPEQMYFCSQSGLGHLYDVMATRKIPWELEDMQLTITAITTAIQWIQPDNTKGNNTTNNNNVIAANNDLGDVAKLREEVVSVVQDYFINIIVGFLPNLKAEHLQIAKAMLQFLQLVMTSDARIAKRILASLSYMYGDDKQILVHPEITLADPYREIFIIYISQLCQHCLTQFPDDEETRSTAFKLALKNGLESLSLPPNSPALSSMVQAIHQLYIRSFCHPTVPQDLPTNSPLYTLLTEFVWNLLTKHMCVIFEYPAQGQRPERLFLSTVYPKLCSNMDAELKHQMIAKWGQHLKLAISSFSHTCSQPLEALNNLISVYSVLELLFVEPQTKQFIQQNYQFQLSFVKHLVDGQDNNGFGKSSQMEKLVELINLFS